MITYKINGQKITDWKPFHSELKKGMEFPNYYGENMDAWIDSTDELTEKKLTLLLIENGEILKAKKPKLYLTILECGAFVNHRKTENGENPNLIISTNF